MRSPQPMAVASTEPHSCECGRQKGPTTALIPLASLQRSRTRVSAEGPMHPFCITMRGQLQRSRTRVSAEGGAPATIGGPIFFASTEPHSCECGRASKNWDRIALDFASTEPHSCECGRKTPAHLSRPGRPASTEPHSCECGRLPGQSRAACTMTGFNGAALV